MESAREFVERVSKVRRGYGWDMNTIIDLQEARDAATRKECADIADDVGYELGLSNSQRQVLVTFIERGRDER